MVFKNIRTIEESFRFLKQEVFGNMDVHIPRIPD